MDAGSTVRTWLRLFDNFPATACVDTTSDLLTTLHRWIVGKTYLRYSWSCTYVCPLPWFPKADKLLSAIVLVVPFQIGSAVNGEYRYLSMDVLQIFNEQWIHNIPYSHRSSYVQSICFLHRLRMSVSCSEAGAYLLTFNRFRITLQRRRPHEPSSRPPCRPFWVAVKAGWHGGRRSTRKAPPRVSKSVTKHGEHSDFRSFKETILVWIHIVLS